MGTGPTIPFGTSKLYGLRGRPTKSAPTGSDRRSTLRPGAHVIDRPRRHDALGGDAEALGTLAAQRLHVELPGCVRVGVDREEAAEVAGQLDELVRRVAPLGARVDLDGDVVLEARAEDLLGIELRWWSLASTTRHEPPRAVGEDVRVRVAHGRDHAGRHLERRLAQLGVDRRGDDVELVEHVVVLVERAVEV